MLTYALIFAFGVVACLALRRLVVVVLRWALMAGGVVLAGRLALMADARPAALTSAVVGGVLGFVVVGLIGYAFVYHALIAADERDAIDRARETAKRRRLW